MENIIKNCFTSVYSFDKIDEFYDRFDLNIDVNKLPKTILDELLKGQSLDDKFVHIYLYHCLQDKKKEYDMCITCQYNKSLEYFNELYFDRFSDEDLDYIKTLFVKRGISND